jgi:hypothetical protein
MEFAYAGGGLGKCGLVTLYVGSKQVGEGTIPMTQAMVLSGDVGAPTHRCRLGRLDRRSPLRAAQKLNIIGPGWQQVGCALRSCQGTSH